MTLLAILYLIREQYTCENTGDLEVDDATYVSPYRTILDLMRTLTVSWIILDIFRPQSYPLDDYEAWAIDCWGGVNDRNYTYNIYILLGMEL